MRKRRILGEQPYLQFELLVNATIKAKLAFRGRDEVNPIIQCASQGRGLLWQREIHPFNAQNYASMCEQHRNVLLGG